MGWGKGEALKLVLGGLQELDQPLSFPVSQLVMSDWHGPPKKYIILGNREI